MDLKYVYPVFCVHDHSDCKKYCWNPEKNVKIYKSKTRITQGKMSVLFPSKNCTYTVIIL